MRLYHFTTARMAERIEADGQLQPHLHDILNRDLLWLTVEADPHESWLFGAVHPAFRRSHVSRIARRFEVDTTVAVPWVSIRGQFQTWRVEKLERARGARPKLWWVSERRIRLAD